MSDLIKGMKDDISELILDFENVFKVLIFSSHGMLTMLTYYILGI